MCLTFVAGEMKDAGRVWKVGNVHPPSYTPYACKVYARAHFLAFFGTGSFFGFPAEFSNRMFEIIGQKCEKRILREIFQSEFESIQNLIIKLS